MTSLGYLVAAYGLFWGGTFALVLSLWVRQRRLDDVLRRLEERLRRAEGQRRARTIDDRGLVPLAAHLLAGIRKAGHPAGCPASLPQG